MRRILMFIISFLVVSCSHKVNESNKLKKQINPSELIGIWGVDNDENAIFRIYKDSILYIDPNSTYKYSIIEDTFMIYQEGLIDKSLILKIDQDSLVLESLEYKVIQGYKRK